jgi:hypothetical protein
MLVYRWPALLLWRGSTAHICRGWSRAFANPSIEALTAVGIALGAELSVRFFPGNGPRIHDRFQASMVEAVVRALDARWQVTLEEPVSHPSRGVIDIVLRDRNGTVVVAGEVSSEVRRLEQQLRWAAEKANGLRLQLERDNLGGATPPVSRLLVLRSTVSTREIARRFEASLATAYPARTRDACEALTTPNAPWPGPAIVWVHLRGTSVSLLATPPPRVRLGR